MMADYTADRKREAMQTIADRRPAILNRQSLSILRHAKKPLPCDICGKTILEKEAYYRRYKIVNYHLQHGAENICTDCIERKAD